jgi:serine protease AprX
MEIILNNSKRAAYTILLLLFISPSWNIVQGQGAVYNYFYRVYFTDKGSYNINSFPSKALLSERAIARREKYGIAFPVFSDLPVFKDYLNQIKSMGFTLHCTSKWLNTGLFKTQNPADMNTLKTLPFVKEARLVKKPAAKSSYSNKLDITEATADPPPFDRPITMLNAYSLHNSGSDGTGILITILDGGFINADKLSSLTNLRARNGIKGTFDFVAHSGTVYSYHNHGTAVLTTLAGDIPFYLSGTAPGADFWLLRTEDVATEFPVEEDFWAAGAEFADSIGTDIISSSLGYFNFDDPTMNYKFSDMDGNTTFVTQAADKAASKGILVVNSAGNERTTAWQRIIAPSDGDSVLAAGAVDANNLIASFSSAGYSYDGRVKPDNCAQGVAVAVQTIENYISRASGTSFSCPVLSGMCACVLQTVPKATNKQIIDAFHAAGDRFANPDSLYGYGIPDMVKVINKLQDILVTKPENQSIAGPNPFTGDLEITFKEVPASLTIEIVSLSGKIVFRKNYTEYISRSLLIRDLQNSEPGIYFIRLITANGTFTHKVIKLNN